MTGVALHVDPKVATPFTKFLAKALATLSPTLIIQGLNASLITRNKSAVEAYLADPLVFTVITLQKVYSMLHFYARVALSDNIFLQSGFRAHFTTETLAACDDTFKKLSQLVLPILCLHGEEDKVTNIEGRSEFMSFHVTFSNPNTNSRRFQTSNRQRKKCIQGTSLHYQNTSTNFLRNQEETKCYRRW